MTLALENILAIINPIQSIITTIIQVFIIMAISTNIRIRINTITTTDTVMIITLVMEVMVTDMAMDMVTIILVDAMQTPQKMVMIVPKTRNMMTELHDPLRKPMNVGDYTMDTKRYVR